MTDETITDEVPAVTEAGSIETAGDKPKTDVPQKKTATKSKKNAAASASNSTKTTAKSSKVQKSATKVASVATPPVERKRNTYTPAQRASILASIEKATRTGKSTLKAALQQAEVSEQTYYNWKNAAGKATGAPSKETSGDDLSALVALEAENLKLRKELAEKLRAENAELRKRLGKA